MAMRVVAARAGLAAALLAVLGLLSPVAAQAQSSAWPSGAVLRFATDGTPVWLSPVAPGASVSMGGGAAALRASQALNIGGQSMPVVLSRAVTRANLATIARLAARSVGPIALAGLAYEGVQWVNDAWLKEVPDGDPDGPSPGRWWIHSHSSGACRTYGEKCTYVGALQAYAAARVAERPGMAFPNPPTFWSGNCEAQVGSCEWKQDFTYTGGTGSLIVQSARATGGPSLRPATDGELDAALSNALEVDPDRAGVVLDSALGFRPVEEAVPGPVVASGAATLEGPSVSSETTDVNGTTTQLRQVTYNVTYQGSTVTVTTTNTTTTTTPDQKVTVQVSTTAAPAGEPVKPAEAPEDKECGLPGTPACKIDESQTPKADDTVSAGQQALKTAFDARDQQLAQNTQRESFGWVPTLPTLVASCSTIQVGNIWTFDPCPGIEIGRTFFAFLWGFLALVYCWRRVGETVAGGV